MVAQLERRSVKKMIRVIRLTVLAVLICWESANGQTADTHPAFEVASVKPAGPFVPGSNSQMRGGPGTDDPGQITYPRVFLMNLLTIAYGVGPDQFSGPDWLMTEQYSVAAKIAPNTTKDRFNLMLQNLLVERFHLAIHHERKDSPVYELVVADGGPKMKPSPADTDAAPAQSVAARRAENNTNDQNGFPVLRPGVPSVKTFAGGMVRSTNRITMAEFAKRLGAMVNESNSGSPDVMPRVVDKTGLAGKFDFTLEFAGTMSMPANVAAAIAAARREQQTPEASGASDPGGDGPNLFTALQKQLGLKLVKGKTASLDILVIDHVDRVPTEN
jgi:uncharacterized protein (TIGR03435 family)